MTTIDELTLNQILDEAKIFDKPDPKPFTCVGILTQFISKLKKGEKMDATQSGDIFFRLTKIFRTKNPDLKKMIYLSIRELSEEPALLMITSSLLKEITGKNEENKVNALKALPYIISSNNPAQSEQLLKTVFMDKNISVINAGLLSSYRISIEYKDHIKRCANEISNALIEKSGTAHYHALNTLYNIKK